MRSSSFYSWGNEITTYQEELDSLIRGWSSELDEIACKIKGSSLKDEDKKKAIKSLISDLLNNDLL